MLSNTKQTAWRPFSESTRSPPPPPLLQICAGSLQQVLASEVSLEPFPEAPSDLSPKAMRLEFPERRASCLHLARKAMLSSTPCPDCSDSSPGHAAELSQCPKNLCGVRDIAFSSLRERVVVNSIHSRSSCSLFIIFVHMVLPDSACASPAFGSSNHRAPKREDEVNICGLATNCSLLAH